MIFLLTIELALAFFYPVIGLLFFFAVIIKQFDDMNVVTLSLAFMGAVGLYGILKLYLHLISSKSYEQGISPSKIIYACVVIALIPTSLGALALFEKGDTSILVFYYDFSFYMYCALC